MTPCRKTGFLFTMKGMSDGRNYLGIKHSRYFESDESIPSFCESDYLIEKEDFERQSQKDREFLKKFKLRLIAAFANKCAKCAADSNGVDIDHFFIPKSKGGCFLMQTKSGRIVCNALPLCESCNRSKSDSPPLAFFKMAEIKIIFRNLREIVTALKG